MGDSSSRTIPECYIERDPKAKTLPDNIFDFLKQGEQGGENKLVVCVDFTPGNGGDGIQGRVLYMDKSEPNQEFDVLTLSRGVGAYSCIYICPLPIVRRISLIERGNYELLYKRWPGSN